MIGRLTTDSGALKGYLLTEEDVLLTPSNKAIKIPNIVSGEFSGDGQLIRFVVNDNGNKTYTAGTTSADFLGYFDLAELEAHNLTQSTNNGVKPVITSTVESQLEECKYSGYIAANINEAILSYGYKYISNNYIETCACKYTFPAENEHLVSNNTIDGDIVDFPILYAEANISDCEGTLCDINTDGLEAGSGEQLFFYVVENYSATDYDNDSLIALCNYISEKTANKSFAFYGYLVEEAGVITNPQSNIWCQPLALKLSSDNSITLAHLKQLYQFEQLTTVDCDYIFSTVDLWDGVPENYNENAIDFVKSNQTGQTVLYEYDFSDLAYRYTYISQGGVLAQGIVEQEVNGVAPAKSVDNYYSQYIECFGTDYATFAWADFASNVSHDVLIAYFANRLAADYATFLLKEAVKDLAENSTKKFLLGAFTELLSNIIVNEIFSIDSYEWDEIMLDAIIAGLKEVVNPQSQISQAAFDCVIGLDVQTIENLFDSEEDFYSNLTIGAIQCLIPAVVGSISNKLMGLITQNCSFTKKAYYYFKNKANFSNENTGDLLYKSLGLDEILNNENTKSLYKNVLSTENGANAMDILLDAQFNMAALSGRNFQRLKNVIDKYGVENRELLVNLFSNTNDVNRMLIFLDNIATSPNEYNNVLNSIIENSNFSNTITIHGQTMNISNYFDNSFEATSYYHKIVGDEHYFSKLTETNGILIIIEKGANGINSVLQNASKEVVESYFIESDKIEIEDEINN
ncbi:hypothetical protein L21SP5_00188 [Salinivirga cyanobacteriivorans]|uniref:Uncharacterized protein n=2 Tax=Salinivirga cyanobacteriivorans TaxID=1307839 RepID=A0A0S2HV99_9BACT|nr:hypothetical protein L21SP5_00188 [Salinivirga cyanobacteriivorans]